MKQPGVGVAAVGVCVGLAGCTTEPSERGIVGGAVVRADGSAPPVELTTGATDQIPRWASPLGPARAGGRDAEPFAWIHPPVEYYERFHGDARVRADAE